MTKFANLDEMLKKCGGEEWEQDHMLSDLLAPDVNRVDPHINSRPTPQLKEWVKSLTQLEKFDLAVEFNWCPVHFIDSEVCIQEDEPECLAQLKLAYPEEFC